MEIERINENTVKFYITYIDIEDRGFEREEIWYNRERSEQLFWQMMDEVNYKEDFQVEGPLWIQVQALEKGLEIVVTKAQAGKGKNTEEPNVEVPDELSLGERLARLTNGKSSNQTAREDGNDDSLWMTTSFDTLEDAIQLSHYFNEDYEKDLTTVFYSYQNKYYIYVEISPELFDHQEDVLSQIFEYSNESDLTYHILDEYAEIIFEDNVFSQIRKFFKV